MAPVLFKHKKVSAHGATNYSANIPGQCRDQKEWKTERQTKEEMPAAICRLRFKRLLLLLPLTVVVAVVVAQ